MPPRSDPSSSPKNWPAAVAYLKKPVHSKSLTAAHISSLRTRSKDSLDIPANIPKGPCQSVKITPISTPAHPACGQSGLFATKDLKPGTFILQYIGEIHTSLITQQLQPPHSNSTSTSTPLIDPHANSDYDLSLDRELGIGIDADTKGNEARFINDYRGVADRANAEFKEIWDERRRARGMGVFVLREGKSGKGNAGIRKGEEILVSYGRGFWGARKEGC